MRHSSFLLLAMLAGHAALSAQSQVASAHAAATHVDSMRATAGPSFTRHRSLHFVLHTEYPAAHASRMLDSLEAALSYASSLLSAAPRREDDALTVFVTASRTRFPRLIGPTNKGVRTQAPDGRDVIVLVVNDSVRSYARHEVMHAVAFRTWGAPRDTAAWLVG